MYECGPTPSRSAQTFFKTLLKKKQKQEQVKQVKVRSTEADKYTETLTKPKNKEDHHETIEAGKQRLEPF